jgi:AcrR family transcriptional regulator
MVTQQRKNLAHAPGPEDAVRERIIAATFRVLVAHGYAGASTREIAKAAKVSKRELYALFGSKQAILAAMIEGRARQMRLPLDLPAADSRARLAETLVRFGATLVREVSHPAVLALFRLAIAEAERSTELARALDAGGREATRAALAEFLAAAQGSGLIAGADAPTMARQFLALLWGDLFVGLLMRVATPPGPAARLGRAQAATEVFLALYPARS